MDDCGDTLNSAYFNHMKHRRCHAKMREIAMDHSHVSIQVNASISHDGGTLNGHCCIQTPLFK